MGIGSDFPLINGEVVSWAEIGLGIQIYRGPKFETPDFTAIDFSDKLTPGDVRAKGPNKRARTVGEYECDGTFSLLLGSARSFQHALRSVAPKNRHGQPMTGVVKFDITVSWAPLDGGAGIHTAKLEGCRVAGREMKNAPGTDGSQVTFPLSLMALELDGTRLI